MATQSGTVDIDLTASELGMRLRREPFRFDFFQAVRLLERLIPDKSAVGKFQPPAQEAVHFGAFPSLAFPASQIQAMDWPENGPVRMTVNFMGLTGPEGVLPNPYTALLIERLRASDTSARDFFDIFNHRVISLFYQAWEKYRSAVAYERDGKDRFSRYLMSLIGLGTDGLQDRMEVKDDSLLFYTGLLALQPRSAVGLRGVLEDYFGVRVEVEQFVGAWQPLDISSQCDLGDTAYSTQVGVGAVVGDEIWDQQSRIRLKLGPLTQEQYLGFLPSGAGYEPLRALTRFFCGTHLEVEVQLVLQQEVVPRCELGEDSLAGPRLGWFTWMKSGEYFDRSPADTVLLLA